MPKRNIIFFTGANTVFLERDLREWKTKFEQKHGEINLLNTHSDTRNPGQTISECLTPGFMGGSRMIILHGLPSKAKPDTTEEKEMNNIFEEKFLEIYDTIPQENFIVFVQPVADKRTRFYKQLIQLATVKEYKEPTLFELQKHIESYLTIDTAASHRLIQKKNSDAQAIESEIQKLALYKPKERITVGDINEFVSEKLENIIFDLIDDLMEKNIQNSLKEFRVLSSNESIFLVYASLMANLRKIIYALILLKSGVPSASISKNLGIHPFTIKKNSKHTGSIGGLVRMYDRLTGHEYDAKTGGHPGSSEEALTQTIEAEIVRFCKKR